MKHSTLLLSLLSAVFILTGCDTAQKTAEKAREKAIEEAAEHSDKGVEVDLDGDKVTIKKKDGEKKAEAARGKTEKDGEGLPDSDQVGGDEIEGVPRYPGSVKTNYVAAEGRQMNRYVADAQKAEVESFYKKEMHGDVQVKESQGGRVKRSHPWPNNSA